VRTEVTDSNSVQPIQSQPPYLNLFQTRSLKTKIKTVVDQGTNFRMVAVITHADDGYLCVSDQTNQLL